MLPQHTSSKKLWLSGLSLLLVLLDLGFTCPPVFAAGTLSTSLQTLDGAAPDFLLRDATGNELKLSDLRGRPVILHFWATWCASCRKELPSLETLAKTLNNDEVTFLLVSIDEKESEEQVKDYLHKLSVGLPLYMARNGIITDRYWTWGVPETYLINPHGQLVGRAIGTRDWQSHEIQAFIKQFADHPDRNDIGTSTK